IAMRKTILDGRPWVARNLYNAFEESKRRSLERILDPAVSRYPVPWLTAYTVRMQQMFGDDTFPYGIEPNRPTLELFLRYAHEQGIAHRLAKPEDIFPAGIMASVKVSLLGGALGRLGADVRRRHCREIERRFEIAGLYQLVLHPVQLVDRQRYRRIYGMAIDRVVKSVCRTRIVRFGVNC